MKNMKRIVGTLSIALAATLCGGIAFADAVQTFDTDPILGPTKAPGIWYTDRYAPAGFESATFDGDERLRQTISSADSSTARPGSFSSGFYDTQGRKYDVDTTYMCIDLWIPSEAYLASVVGTRFAGFWGTMVDGADNITGYPIIEYRQDGAGDFGFSVWNGVGWDDLGAPGGFTNEAWYSLEMILVGDDVTFNIGDITHTVEYTGSVRFDNVILQGYNTASGVDYDIYWDNLKTEQAPIPEPTTLSLLGLGLAGMAIRRRRQKA